MCGIAGYMLPSGQTDDTRRLLEMARVMRHRGPDDEGFVLINSQNGKFIELAGSESDPQIASRLQRIEDHGSGFSHDIALAHRRYSIIDPSPDGHQPMWDAGKNVCVSFYGEIYNYIELRIELERNGAEFNTSSDTEVLLQSYLCWGTEAFKRCNGPFAIALYDTRSRKLLFARDRLGKASFYYTIKENTIFWASEIKAFLKIFGVNSFTVRDQAVHDYVVNGMRDFDGTFWTEIKDFPPGSLGRIGEDLNLKTEKFWRIPEARMTAKDITVPEATARFRDLLSDAVRIRLRADVPVAFELSGGLDSSSIVALTAAQSSARMTTYTVKNRETHADEEPYARTVRDMYPDKIDYRVLIPERDDFWENADAFFWTEEEPFHSPNVQTNQQIRSLMRRQGSRVVVSGAAGDEVLAGYVGDYFQPYLRYLLQQRRIVSLFRELALNSEPSSYRFAAHFTANTLLPPWLIAHIKRLRPDRHQYLRDIFRIGELTDRIRPDTEFGSVMIQNMGQWKMNYWLRAGSKANFGIPIEPRVPFLDYRLVDFCFQLPPEYLIQNGWHKWILRQTVKNQLPDKVVWRKEKMGFPFPLSDWLISSRDIVFDNLSEIDCRYVSIERLRKSYNFLAGKAPDHLWRLVCLALWWRRMVEGRPLIGALHGSA